MGPAIVDQNDIYGDTVNVAAAMREIAVSRQVIVTETVVQRMPPELLHRTRRFDTSRLKGRQEKTVIYELQWEDEDTTQMLSAAEQGEDEKVTRLQLTYKGEEISLLEEMPAITIGRDSTCTMIIEGKLVSRLHATIEYRKGKFIYIDSSTNGTYIRTEKVETFMCVAKKFHFGVWGTLVLVVYLKRMKPISFNILVASWNFRTICQQLSLFFYSFYQSFNYVPDGR